MDKNVIKQIILWQQEFVGKVKLQGRNISLEENANYVLVGIRRAGKSYMLYQKIQNLVEQGHSLEEILFINFEDERITDIRKEEWRTRQTLWSAVQMLTQKLCCQTIHDCPKVVPLHYESE